MTKIKFLVFLFLISCGSNQEIFKSENVILFKSKKHIIYTSKKDFSKTLNSWMKNFPLAKNDNKNLFDIFESKKSQIFLDLYQITSKKRNDSLTLNYLTADLLKKRKAFIYNIENKKIENIRVDSTETNYLFFVKNDTVYNAVFKVIIEDVDY